MKKFRHILWAAVAVSAVVYMGLDVWRGSELQNLGASSQSATATFSPVFDLVDHNGNAVTEESYMGRWLLVFFGFTNCPDICPTTLSDLAMVMDRIEMGSEAVTPLFISVDPERDRVESLAEYVSAFHTSIVGLTGTGEQVADAAKAFKVYFEKQQSDNAQGGYAVAHTSAVYLISPDGAFVRSFGYGTTPETFIADLENRL